MLNFHLDAPAPVLLAREKKPGLHWIIEILVFAAVYFASSIGQVIFLIPGQVLLMLSSPEYQAAPASGDEALIRQAAERLSTSDGYMALALLSDVMIIAVVLLFCRLLQKRGPASLGFTRRGAGREYLKGAAAGFLVFSAAVLLCVVTGSLRLEGLSPAFRPGMFALLLISFLVQGMAEEVLCRGYFMVSFARGYPLWAAVAVNSIAFSALHLSNDGVSALALVNLVLFGVFASLYFIRRGSIWGIGAFHSLWNLAQGNVYGVQVSGHVMSCTLLRSTAAAGRDVIHGGAFGLEGGLAVTVVLAAGSLFLLYRRKDVKPEAAA